MIKIDSYSKDIAAAATPEDLRADSTPWKYAKEVIIRCPAGNSTDLLIGSRSRQVFPILKGTQLVLSSVINRMSQSDKFDLSEIFVKAQTNADDVEILLIDPSND